MNESITPNGADHQYTPPELEKRRRDRADAKLRTLIRKASKEFETTTDEQIARLVADWTPPHELIDQYVAALCFAVRTVLEEDADEARNAFFGPGLTQ